MKVKLSGALTFGSLVLAGCGGSIIVPTKDPSDLIGVPAANGLPLAGADRELADAEEVEMQVMLVRALANYDENFLGIRVTEETVQLVNGYLSGGSRDKVVTLDGVPIVFIDGLATYEGQTLERFTYLQGETAQIEGIFSYDGDGTEGFDVEALYLFGFETADETLNLREETATYLGRFRGYGHVAYGGRRVIGSEVLASGDIELTADFSTNRVGGTVYGLAEFEDGISLVGTFADAEIAGNSFAAQLTMSCPDGATCESTSSLGGAFFDQTGGEIAGLIGFDETHSTGRATETLRFVGAAGFTAMEDSTP